MADYIGDFQTRAAARRYRDEVRAYNDYVNTQIDASKLRQDVIEQLIPYVKEELKKGTRLNQIMRHTLGLFHGQTGSSYWKRYLSENMCVRDADVKKIDHIMDKIKFNNVDTSVGQSA